MSDVTSMSRQELETLRDQLQVRYDEYKAQNLTLDMSRGKPSGEQLDHTNGILETLDSYITRDGIDARNYGVLDGIPEVKELFSEVLDIPVDEIIIGGNSSLNLMYDSMCRNYIHGASGHTPWCKLDKVKWLCPSPGYDRHFAICEDLGFEMITVPMTENGPDMDMVEELVANDDSIKGMWCVPLYSNPQGIIYSDETIDRLASMKTAAPDFRIMWDNAYGIHHVYKENKVKDIRKAAKEAGNEDRILYYFSTSKITFPGAGVALMAASKRVVAEIKQHLAIQTIGHDKINQLRTLKFFKNADGMRAHMKILGDELKAKFDIVLDTLDRELAGSGLLTWNKPDGGYFVAVDTLEGCAKATVALAKEAGVVLTNAGATYPYGNDPKDTNIRIAPSYPTTEELQQAMDLFCVCVKLAGVNHLLNQ
ncbi:MAG: aminotransferase class I/II-fold pyridoxal phosphate-dependent enzyme [Lachnospiraceae bacterium]